MNSQSIAMKQMKFGIASVAEQRIRSLAIAAGTRQRRPEDPHKQEKYLPSVG